MENTQKNNNHTARNQHVHPDVHLTVYNFMDVMNGRIF